MKIFYGVLALLLVVPLVSSAADVRTGETLFIPSNDYVTDNLYVAGGEVTVSGTSGKDLMVAGGKVIINGATLGDALVMGGTADILERTQGDVRVLGGQITVGAPIQGDLIVVGGRLHLTQGGSVSGDVIVFGGEVIIDGAINGDVEVYAGRITINSLIGGEVTLHVGESVSFGEKAVVGNAVAYTAPDVANIHENAKLGEVTYTESAVPREVVDGTGIAMVLATVAGIMLIVKFFAYLTAAIVVALVFKRMSLSVVQRTVAGFWSSVGIGLVTFLVTPVVILILAFTVFGLIAAFVVGILYLLLIVMSAIYAGFIVGGYLAKLIKKEVRANWKWAALGTVVLSLVSLIPIVGWVLTTIFFLAALGQLSQSAYRDAQAKM